MQPKKKQKVTNDVLIDVNETVRTSESNQDFNHYGCPIITDKQKKLCAIIGESIDLKDGLGPFKVLRAYLDSREFYVHYDTDEIDQNCILDFKHLKEHVKNAKGSQKNVYVYESRDWELTALLHKPEMDFNRIVNRLHLRLLSANEGGVDFETNQDYKGLNNRLKKLNIAGGIQEFFDVRAGLLDLHITTAATIWANALFE